MADSDYSQSRNELVVESHIYSLFSMAAADGKLHRKELQIIYTIAQEYGVSENKLTDIYKNQPYANNYQKPRNKREKFEYIFDLILVMMADGEMTKDELTLAKKIGLLMDIRESLFEEIMEKMNELSLLTHDKDEMVSYIYHGFENRM